MRVHRVTRYVQAYQIRVIFGHVVVVGQVVAHVVSLSSLTNRFCVRRSVGQVVDHVTARPTAHSRSSHVRAVREQSRAA